MHITQYSTHSVTLNHISLHCNTNQLHRCGCYCTTLHSIYWDADSQYCTAECHSKIDGTQHSDLHLLPYIIGSMSSAPYSSCHKFREYYLLEVDIEIWSYLVRLTKNSWIIWGWWLRWAICLMPLFYVVSDEPHTSLSTPITDGCPKTYEEL